MRKRTLVLALAALAAAFVVYSLVRLERAAETGRLAERNAALSAAIEAGR